jgi:hypothetical protein
MTLRLISRAMVVLAAIGVMTACGEDNIAPPTAPTPPTVTTEAFTGTVTRNGGVTHTFNTLTSGTVVATLSQFSAADGTKIGLALGTYNGSACQLVITKDDATLGTAVTGAVSALGSLCVRVYDVGNLTASADYEVQVSHP